MRVTAGCFSFSYSLTFELTWTGGNLTALCSRECRYDTVRGSLLSSAVSHTPQQAKLSASRLCAVKQFFPPPPSPSPLARVFSSLAAEGLEARSAWRRRAAGGGVARAAQRGSAAPPPLQAVPLAATFQADSPPLPPSSGRWRAVVITVLVAQGCLREGEVRRVRPSPGGLALWI